MGPKPSLFISLIQLIFSHVVVLFINKILNLEILNTIEMSHQVSRQNNDVNSQFETSISES